MIFLRRVRLAALSACLCAPWITPIQAQQQQPPTPQQQPPATPPATPPQQQPQPPQRPTNPFESVPTEQQAKPPEQQPAQPQPIRPQPVAPQPAQPQPATPPAAGQTLANPNGQVIEAFEFRGAKRVPQDTLKAMIVSKAGDIYNDETLRRDYMALWNTGRFDDITLEVENGRTGLIVRFVVVERRVIRSIDYPGAKSVTVSEILDRFKERKVGLSVESQYDPNKVQRAAVVLKEFLAERGRQYASVEPQVEQIPPSSLKVSFVVNEGPKVKVGKIDIVNNTAKSDKWVINAMKKSKTSGSAQSTLFENIFAKTYARAKLDEDKERIRQAYQDAGYFTAKTLDETVDIQHRGGKGWRLPLLKMNLPGISADIKLPVEEGRLYHLR